MTFFSILIILVALTVAPLHAQALNSDREYTAIVNEAVARVADATAASNAAATNLFNRIGELETRYRNAEAGSDRYALRAARSQLMAAHQASLREYRESLSDLLAKATEAIQIVSAATAAGKAASPAEADAARKRIQAVDAVLVGLSAIPATSADASEAWATISEMANLAEGDERLPTGRLLLLKKSVEARIARIDRALLRGDTAALCALLNDLDCAPEGADFLSGFNAFCSEISSKSEQNKGTGRRKLRARPAVDNADIDITKPF